MEKKDGLAIDIRNIILDYDRTQRERVYTCLEDDIWDMSYRIIAALDKWVEEEGIGSKG